MLEVVVLRILSAALDEVHLNLAKVKFFLEKINDEIDIKAVLTRVNVCAHKMPTWKCMNANVTLGDNDKSAPTPGILNVVIWSRHNLHSAEWLHL